MPSVNPLEFLICFSPEASKQVEHTQLILPQLTNHNNTFMFKDVKSLNAPERKIWTNFFAPLFYQGQAWIEHQGEKLFFHDHLEWMFETTLSPSTELSPSVAVYHAQNKWHLHHTQKNWVYQSTQGSSQLLSPQALSSYFGFFEKEVSTFDHVVEDLFTQYSCLKNESPIKIKYQRDAFDDFPNLENPIQLERAFPEWEVSWHEIRQKRQSNDSPNSDGLSLGDLGRFLDLSLSADKMQNQRAKRGYPAAGGFYSECVLIEANQVSGLERGTYLYHPHQHALYLISSTTHSKESITILLASRIDILRKKYFKISTRLMLMNTGVILHQLNLSCALMGLNGHPHGTIQQHPWGEKLKNIWSSDWRISGRYIIN